MAKQRGAEDELLMGTREQGPTKRRFRGGDPEAEWFCLSDSQLGKTQRRLQFCAYFLNFVHFGRVAACCSDKHDGGRPVPPLSSPLWSSCCDVTDIRAVDS